MNITFLKSVRIKGGVGKAGETADVSDAEARFLVSRGHAVMADGSKAKPKGPLKADPVTDEEPAAPKKKAGRPPKNRAAESEETR